MRTITLGCNMITIISLLLAAGVASVEAFHHPHATHLHNVIAVHMEPGTSCAETIGAALLDAGCEAVLRVDVQTKLATMCSYEILNKCNHMPAITSSERLLATFPVARIIRPMSKEPVRELSTYNPDTKVIHNETGDVGLDVIHTITGVLDARNKLGLIGEGVKVAIVDTGVYYLHPALGGGFGPGYKVAFGYDLVGDDFDPDYPSLINPDDDPIDNCTTTGSQGTHIAGVIAANATGITTPGFKPPFPFTGVAPGATLGAYRIYGCNGVSSADIAAKAILLAAEDGADIIHLSYGVPDYADSIVAAAADVATRAGHIVVSSNGNSGGAGAYIANGPGQGGFGIGSFDNVVNPSLVLSVDGADYPYTYGTANWSFTFNVPYSGQFVANNPNAIANGVLDDGCGDVNADVIGKAVLFYWKEPRACRSKQRCDSAYFAGATACIIYFQSEDIASINGISGSSYIPSLLTTFSAGQAIITDLAMGKDPVVVVKDQISILPSLTGGTLTFSSSPGLTNELFIKPDLGGIGGHVYSTISPFAGNPSESPYTSYSGTDVAASYVAGCLALLLQKRGKLGFEEARAYLQNTATVTNIYNSSLIHSPAYQGAGLVNIYKAATTGTLVTPSALSLNDTANKKSAEYIRIKNNYDADVGSITYYLSHVPAATANTFNSGDEFVLDKADTSFTSDNIASVKFGVVGRRLRNMKIGNKKSGKGTKSKKGKGDEHAQHRGKAKAEKRGGKGEGGLATGEGSNNLGNPVTVQPGKSVTVRLDIVAPVPAAPDLWPLYGGYIAITNSFDNIVTHVPYAGVAGIWKDRKIWARNSTSLYRKWGLIDSSGPGGQYGLLPTSVGTGLYTDETFTPLTKLSVVNGSEFAFVILAVASASRSANITVSYLCNNDKPLRLLGLQRTNLVSLVSSNYRNVVQAGVLLRRNAYRDYVEVLAPNIFRFFGEVSAGTVLANESIPITLPEGVYQINFVARKNFATDDSDVDVISTPPFQLIHSEPLSDEFLADCQV